ncbi:MAG: RNA polymerase sigma factor [Patescibacteria group bacterium]|jgi:RNA polymerase sigma-70 factor (ECF subfamily)
MDDKDLIIEYGAGNREAFGELYDRYARKIYDFVFFRVSNKEVAEDLTSDIFLKACKKIKDFIPSGAGFGAWLYRIARNRVIDYYRTNKKNYNLEVAENLSDEGRWAEGEDNRLLVTELQEKLEILKPEQRDIILMRAWDELSYKEIATIIGKSEAAAKMLFFRALKILKEKLPEDIFILLCLILIKY